MSGTKQSELEGLANRIALLVGDDGEAESAGRAVGMMARRLGLSGGHLKAIFMAGAGSLGAAAKQTAELAARAERLSGETQGLEHSLEQLEIALHQANRERDALRAEVGSLELALDGARSGRRLQLTLGGLLLLAVLVGGGYAWFGLAQPGNSGGGGPVAASMGHAAVVRAAGTTVYAEADLGSAVRAKLPGGVRLPVRQLVWRNFSQWVQTRLGGRTGYVQVTDVDLPD